MFSRREPTTTTYLVTPGPQGNTRGLTWLRDDVRRRRRKTVAIATTLLVALTGASTYGVGMVAAGKGGKGGPPKDSGGSDVTWCADLGGSTTLHAVNVAIGADDYHKPKGKQQPIMGTGIDVAVIDTGVNAVGVNALVDGPDLSFDALEDNLRHRDLHGHGTNMAGIIATNTATEWGVAPESRIVNVKVGAGDGAVDVSQIIAAIDWVVQNRHANGMNIRVVNLAYSTDADVDYRADPLTHAVENAWHHGIVVVAAGGNEGRSVHRLGNPALDPYVIAVGAAETDSDSPDGWRVPSWSSKADGGRNPDLVAPGDAVLSLGVAGSNLADTYPGATCTGSDDLLRLRGSGTSQAAAVVSGAVAMLLEQRPELTPDQVKYLLTSTATNLRNDGGDPRPPEQQGHGMVNLAAALEAPTPGDEAVQAHETAVGGGSLEAARGGQHVGAEGDQLTGELTAFGEVWDSADHALAQSNGTAWTDQTWSGSTWSGGTWSGSTWSGSTWSGSTWSGSTWSGSTWSGSTWSGSTWSGSTWSGSTWSGSTWSGSTWSGSTWSGSTWS
jgi:serine protease AprX